MDARVLLYAVPGFPLHVEDLMPQPLLARCAGGLRAHGHQATIFDDGSIDALSEVIGADLPEVLGAMLEGDLPPKHRWTDLLSASRRHQQRTLDVCLKRRVERAVEASAVTGAEPHVAILFAQRRKDVREVLHLAQVLKTRSPGLCIVIAGKMAAHYGRQIMLTCSAIDIACFAMPESSIPGLAAHWAAPDTWSQIPGLLTRKSTGLYEVPGGTSTTMSANTSPAYHPDAYPSLLDGGKFNLFTLGQGWGLSHVGHYRSGLEGGLQTKPVRQLRQEIMALHELYGAQAFHITGEHTPEDKVLEFSRDCLSLPFPVAYSRDTHIFEISSYTASALSASGCRALGFSLLTGSQMTLTDYFGENWGISDAVSCLRACRQADLYLHTDFVHPVPADDHHTRAETIRLLHRCQPDSLRLFLPDLMPGSAWHQHATEFSFSLNRNRMESWVRGAALGMNTMQEAALLPYTLSGQGSASPTRLLEAFEAELEGFDPPIESGCEVGLIARISGYQGEENAFTQELEQATKTLDLAKLRARMDTFNMQATASIKARDFYLSTAAQKAVGSQA